MNDQRARCVNQRDLFAGPDLVVTQLITYSWKQITKIIDLTRHVYLTQFINVSYSY